MGIKHLGKEKLGKNNAWKLQNQITKLIIKLVLENLKTIFLDEAEQLMKTDKFFIMAKLNWYKK